MEFGRGKDNEDKASTTTKHSVELYSECEGKQWGMGASPFTETQKEMDKEKPGC